ncbi:quinone oxidoreductase-like protein 2 isoform X1 [Acipenser ruthenus]|uniref:quinone oxidoreductase-like protein 2 isoform X1 n=1 Tax=Acipenser ruthenus TaxID=7906 RepID=UPI00145A1CD4|nr:quinone oxidoreductase-like protein 2 isoform X1 [Acipenser ruthenus]
MAARFGFQTVPERIFRQLLRRGPSVGESSSINRVSSQPHRTYRAAVCTELKKPLVLQDLQATELKPAEVRVSVHCCGVNFADILACQGLYQEKPPLPFTPGMEFSGCVVETGSNVTTVQEGDRVMGVSGGSAMAEECIVDQKVLWKIPEEVGYEEAAALPVSYGTGLLALQHRAATQPGETVLVTAAAGGAGLAAVDIAAHVLQAKVIAAAGSDEKCALAVQKGAYASINYNTSNLKEELKKLTNKKGVNVVFDAVGGDIFKDTLSSLSWEGRILVVGFAGGSIPSVPANLLLLKNISAMGVFWGRYREQDFPVFSQSISRAVQLCQEGKIRPHIGAVFKLQQVNEAFLQVMQRASVGKVVLSMK